MQPKLKQNSRRRSVSRQKLCEPLNLEACFRFVNLVRQKGNVRHIWGYTSMPNWYLESCFFEMNRGLVSAIANQNCMFKLHIKLKHPAQHEVARVWKMRQGIMFSCNKRRKAERGKYELAAVNVDYPCLSWEERKGREEHIQWKKTGKRHARGGGGNYKTIICRRRLHWSDHIQATFYFWWPYSVCGTDDTILLAVLASILNKQTMFSLQISRGAVAVFFGRIFLQHTEI